MPARQPELEVVPSYNAVLLAPDTPLKREVVALAEQLMAAPMALLSAAVETCARSIQRFHIYLDGVMHKPPLSADAEKPAQRDPDMVSFSQGQRALAQAEKLSRDMLRLREQCYRQARETVFLRTHRRVGPRFWPTQAFDAGLAPDPTEDGLELLPKRMPTAAPGAGEPEAQAAPGISEPESQAAPGVSQPASAAPDPAQLPLTNHYLKFGQEQMARAGVSKARQVALIRRARKEGWMVKRFYQETAALVIEAETAAAQAQQTAA